MLPIVPSEMLETHQVAVWMGFGVFTFFGLFIIVLWSDVKGMGVSYKQTAREYVIMGLGACGLGILSLLFGVYVMGALVLLIIYVVIRGVYEGIKLIRDDS